MHGIKTAGRGQGHISRVYSYKLYNQVLYIRIIKIAVKSDVKTGRI